MSLQFLIIFIFVVVIQIAIVVLIGKNNKRVMNSLESLKTLRWNSDEETIAILKDLLHEERSWIIGMNKVDWIEFAESRKKFDRQMECLARIAELFQGRARDITSLSELKELSGVGVKYLKMVTSALGGDSQETKVS